MTTYRPLHRIHEITFSRGKSQMATDNTAAPNRGIDDILEQTEMGSFIAKNKASMIGVVAALIIGVVGFGVWNWMQSKRNVQAETTIYEYTQGSLASFKDKKIDPQSLVNGFENLSTKLGGFKGVFPIGLETSSLLIDAGENDQAIKVLTMMKPSASNPYQQFVLATTLSVAYENSGKNDLALETLESLIKSNAGFMEAKVYLDLGRLALANGQTDKARSNLEWVINQGNDAEMTLLAKLYLSQLDK